MTTEYIAAWDRGNGGWVVIEHETNDLDDVYSEVIARTTTETWAKRIAHVLKEDDDA